jgi:DNA-binding LacI/PurR family transcriptional regulator
MKIRQYAVDLVSNSMHKEEKIMSERALCDFFRVTRPTVRKALKDLVDDNYLTIRPGLGTYTNPAKAMKNIISQDILSIGIIVGDGKHVLYSCYYGDVIAGIISYINKQAGFFRILNISEKGSKIVDEIMLMNLSGLIWINPPANMYKVCEEMENRGISMMTVGKNPNGAIDNVSIDYSNEGYIAARYFLDKGLSNIVYAAFNHQSEADVLRLSGFKQAFNDANKIFNNKLILKAENDIVSDLHKMTEFGVDFAGIYANGFHLYKVMEALKKEKHVLGKDLLIVGSEHILRGIPNNNFTIVVEPLEKLGWIAAEKLANKISGKITDKIELKLKPHI